MTKADEITTLDHFIQALGPDSYLGPWLAGMRDSVAWDIRNDVMPTPNIQDTRRECSALVAAAKAEAEQVRAEGRRQYAEATESWRLKAETLFTEAHVQLHNRADSLYADLMRLRNLKRYDPKAD